MATDVGINAGGETPACEARILQDGFELEWREGGTGTADPGMNFQRGLPEAYLKNRGHWLLSLGFLEESAPLTDSVRFLARLSQVFVQAVARDPDIESLRDRIQVEIESDEIHRLLSEAPYMAGAEYLDERWVRGAFAVLQDTYAAELCEFAGSVSAYFAAHGYAIHRVGRVFFHLVDNQADEYPFAFLATYAAGLTPEGKSRHLPLQHALAQYEGDHAALLELLSTVNRVSEKSRFVADLVESGDIFHPIGLTSIEAYTFLQEVTLYEEAGILCRIPNWWKKKNAAPRLAITVGDREPSRLGFDTLLDFRVELSIAGQMLTAEECRGLLSETEGLALIKGKWVEVNHDKLHEALALYERSQAMMARGKFNLREAMRLQLDASSIIGVPNDGPEVEVTNGEWLETVLSKLAQPAQLQPISQGPGFRADLRGYQQTGVAWLSFMKQLGLGACLADDMGLGKTVQILALLHHAQSQGRNEKTLLVVPASLVGNWMDEIAKFAPSLFCYVVHPSENADQESEAEALYERYSLFLTTYGMLQRTAWLKESAWDTLILDEAQAIKNPSTKQTKAVKQIRAGYRIAMTGTPIENRLSDLWSLFDFLNQGLLGSAKEFTEFTKTLRERQEGYSRLKHVVGPFILRRLKTDKAVIADLPDKIEMKTFARLGKKQAALYAALVDDIKARLEIPQEGMARRGLILSSLIKFKQICNHPDHYLGQGGFAEAESGKFLRLREICETIRERRERVLVFTQYREITEPLGAFLEQVFGRRGLILHGGTPVSKRREIVDEFQAEDYVPFLVLSLKAGGVGLNLTAANHVVHFDRWWNPAMENQATDRAFRIGQKRNVMVHKFITTGTIEEKIDSLIEDKTRLSQEIIPEVQETWITEMDDRQLIELFTLSL